MIDFRVRPPTPGFLAASMYEDLERTASFAQALGFATGPDARWRSPEVLHEFMRSAGVDIAVVPVRRGCGIKGDVSNEEILDFCRASPGRFLALASPDPALAAEEMVADVARWMRHPEFRGLNLEPGYFAAPRMVCDGYLDPLYEECSARGWPVVVLAGGNAGPDLGYSHPELLDKVLCSFPRLRVVVAHGGYPWHHQILHLALRRPNLYLCPDMYWLGVPGAHDLVAAANGYLRNRIVFASNFPFLEPGQVLERLGRAGLSDESWTLVTDHNARALLGA